jgi:hypothetical protein
MANFYTPANALLVALDGERLAFLPAFDPQGFPDDYRAYERTLPRRVARLLPPRAARTRSRSTRRDSAAPTASSAA